MSPFLRGSAFEVPLFVRPWEVIERIQTGSLEPSTVHIMAVMMPVLALMTLLLLGVVIIGLFAVLDLERKYLAMIDALQAQPDSSPAR